MKRALENLVKSKCKVNQGQNQSRKVCKYSALRYINRHKASEATTEHSEGGRERAKLRHAEFTTML